MGWGYELAYRLGITPWEGAAQSGAAQLGALLDREAPPGAALDLGCGRGANAVALAVRGWRVTGVDQVERALVAARRRAAEAGVDATFVQGDVTGLPPEVGTRYSFVLDVGCFHGLDDEARVACAAELRRVTTPGATALVLAFQPGGPPLLPRGITREQLLAALTGWEVLAEDVAETSGVPAPLRRLRPTFYRLRRAV